MTIAPYYNGAEQIGTEAYLNTGAGHLFDNVHRDRIAQAFFAVDKFYAAEYEARYGEIPFGMPQARQRHGGGPPGEGTFSY